MKETCSFCGNEDSKSKKVDYIYRKNGKMMVVSEVPCRECTYCGERYYAAEVLLRIESDFEAIQDGSRRVERHMTIPVEDFSQLVG